MKLRHLFACFALMGLMVSCGGGEKEVSCESGSGSEKSCFHIKGSDTCSDKNSGSASAGPDGNEMSEVTVSTKVDSCEGYQGTCEHPETQGMVVTYYHLDSDDEEKVDCESAGGAWSPI